METNNSKMSLSEITTQAIALPYHERIELMGKLIDSLRKPKYEEPPKDEEYWRKIADKYQGCMKGTWDGVDAVEYQRSLREDREIG